MYCVKCGVKLQDGIKACPLCNTVVIDPENTTEFHTDFSDIYPDDKNHERMAFAAVLTAITLTIIIIITVLCLKTYGELSWGGYPVFGILLFYILFFFPLWFKTTNPVIFWPVDFLSIGLFLYYINQHTGGHWFYSFALPIVVVLCMISTTAAALVRYVKTGRFFIAGGIILAIGVGSVIIEYFETITFHTSMWKWSLYVLSFTVIFGIFMIIVGIIPPLKKQIQKRFFI